MLVRMSAVAVIAGMMTVGANADEIQWTQTQNIEKGVNFPDNLKADILGLETGDSYAEAKAKLEKLKAETAPVPGYAAPKIMELKQGFYLSADSGQRIEIAYVGAIKLDRHLQGQDSRGISEMIKVHLSAPSSGHQVVAVERLLSYHGAKDQIRISELVDNIKEKFGPEPQITKSASGSNYLWQFNERQPFSSNRRHHIPCNYIYTGENVNADEVKNINRDGECDAAFKVDFNHGISGEHALSVWFKIYDGERLKSNLAADYAFFDTYVERLRARTGAAPPKL